MSSTIQCHSCYKHARRTKILHMRNMPPTRRRFKQKGWSTIFKTLTVPNYFARINRSRGKKKCGDSQWQGDHWKATDAWRAAIKNGRDTITIRRQLDQQYRESQMTHGWPEEYCKYFLIFSRRLILTTRPRGDTDTDTKVLLHWPWLQKIVNADPWIEEVITNPLLCSHRSPTRTR